MFQMQRCRECGDLATHGSQLDGYTCDKHQQSQKPVPRRSVSITMEEALKAYAKDISNQLADQDWLLDHGIEPFPVNNSFADCVEAMAHGYTHVTAVA